MNRYLQIVRAAEVAIGQTPPPADQTVTKHVSTGQVTSVEANGISAYSVQKIGTYRSDGSESVIIGDEVFSYFILYPTFMIMFRFIIIFL